MRWEPSDPPVREAILTICRLVAEAGGRALLVGGCVRDALLDRVPDDFDIEVYGVAPARFDTLLTQHFTIDRVGQAFGILKLRGLAIDVSVPRRENKTGLGHRGFLVSADPALTPQEAVQRRDFTVNAILFDPLKGELIDPAGGVADLRRRVLRHVSAKFAEDPLRVLRGMQMVARFELMPAPQTVALCRSLDLEGLAPERFEPEWRKLLLKGIRPSLGLTFLRETEWLRFFPELADLIGCPQDPRLHPEGDVWTHTLQCVDAFAGERTGDDGEDWIVGLAVLCHDMGKPATTVRDVDRIRSPGHSAVGVSVARRFLQRLTRRREIVAQVLPLVADHLSPRQLYAARAGAAAVRRLARRVGRIDRLVRVARADQMGRRPQPFDGFPAGDWLLEQARQLAVQDSRPRPLIRGRDLVTLGLAPGPRFRTILDACYEAQLDGAFTTQEDGIAYVRRWLTEHGDSPEESEPSSGEN